MAKRTTDDDSTARRTVGRVLDSRWMLAIAVLAVLVAIAWALLDRDPATAHPTPERSRATTATVELLGVPPGAEITLDGERIENVVFAVTPGVRHALEVRDPGGRSWRQVFLASGSLSLVVQLHESFVEIPVDQAME